MPGLKVEFKLRLQLVKCLKVLQKYEWLLNSYMLDFYVDDHWHKLPTCWQEQLNCVSLTRLSALLEHNTSIASTPVLVVWPLELLALRQLLNELCLCRLVKDNIELPTSALLQHPKLKKPATKCIKKKKMHEIERMSGICVRNCRLTNVDFVVDFGAGLGHLARALGYSHGVLVCCLEMQHKLNEQAETIDIQLEGIAAKHLQASELAGFKRPMHLTLQLSENTQPADFVNSICGALQIEGEFSFGIIGLHPCGDLGAILIRMFLACRQAKFLNFVGCCYQKLSTPQGSQTPAKTCGYPLSAYLCSKPALQVTLRYESREISCHAIEMYHDRLVAGEYDYLKVHSFRAAAERVIMQHFPSLKHAGLRSVKHVPGMTFEEYFYKAVQGTPIANIDPVELQNPTTKTDLLQWRRIVIYYTLRLMLAPLIESIILYDRKLFLIENDCQVDIEAIFDPRVSPRNHITSALKL